MTLVGTTDVDHPEDPDEGARISAAETDYLMAWARHVFPTLELRDADVQATFAGVRPVIGSGKADPSAESRDHACWEESGLLTVTGGKLTTFDAIARDALTTLKPRFAGRVAGQVPPGLRRRRAAARRSPDRRGEPARAAGPPSSRHAAPPRRAAWSRRSGARRGGPGRRGARGHPRGAGSMGRAPLGCSLGGRRASRRPPPSTRAAGAAPPGRRHRPPAAHPLDRGAGAGLGRRALGVRGGRVSGAMGARPRARSSRALPR